MAMKTIQPLALKYDPDTLLLVVDLVGTFVFAVEGGMAAVAGDLDLLGLMALSFVTALGGGIMRDMLIGAIPPNSIRDWRYGTVALSGGVAVFFFSEFFHGVHPTVMTSLDAAGLALFAVAGAAKALEYGLSPFIAVLMGGITGVGGGVVRDVLLAQVPTVLRADVYATAAIAGAAVMVAGLKLRFPRALMMSLGGVVCFLLRMVSVWRHWNLPRVP